MKKGNWLRRGMSLFLTAVLMIGISFQYVSLVKAADKVITFKDFGIADGVLADGTYSANLTTMDKVTMQGMIKFVPGTYFIPGHDGSQDWVGIQMIPEETTLRMVTILKGADGAAHRFKMNGGNQVIITAEEVGIKSFYEETKYSLAFAYTDEGVEVKVSIGDKLVKTILIGDSVDSNDNAKDCIGTNLYSYGRPEVASLTQEETPIEEKELTFKDYGITDGVLADGTYSANLTTMDKVTMQGMIKFVPGTYFIPGHDGSQDWVGLQMAPEETTLRMVTILKGADGVAHRFKMNDENQIIITAEEAGIQSFYEEAKYSLAFAYTDEGVEVKVSIGDKLVKTVLIGDSVDSNDNAKDCIGTNLYSYGRPEVASLTQEETPVEEKELTFKDYGITDGVLADGTYSANLTTMDKVTMQGMIKFVPGTYFIPGHDGSQDWVGLQMAPEETTLRMVTILKGADGAAHQFKMNDENQIIITAEEAGIQSFYEEAKYSLAFAYTDEGVEVKVSIGDKLVKTVLIGNSVDSNDNAKDCIGTNLYSYGRPEVASIKSVPPIPTNPDVFVFEDFGIKDGTIKDGSYKAPFKSWDNVALEGTLTFLEGSLITLGHDGSKEWVGIQLNPSADVLTLVTIFMGADGNAHRFLMDNGNNVKISAEEANVKSFYDEIDFRFSFAYSGDNIVASIAINGREVRAFMIGQSMDSADLAKDCIGNCLFSYGRPVAGKTKQTEPVVQKTPEELGFKEITLAAFGLESNATYSAGDKPNYWRFEPYVRPSLHMTYLNTDIQFEKGSDAKLAYASADGWRGIAIYVNNDKLYLTNAEFGTGKSFSVEEIGLKDIYEEFNLKLGIRMGDFSMGTNAGGKKERQCNVIYVSMWINDTLIVKDMTLNDVIMAGNGIGMYLTKGSIKLSIPKGAYAGVDFSLVGFTQNWEKELGLK